jgi:outer membrane protein assembly factor BamA
MLRAYHYTLFYYNPYLQYDPTYSRYLTYRDALATRKITGVNLSAYYPFNLYYRASASLSYNNYSEEYFNPTVTIRRGPSQQFLNGNLFSASFSIIGETTRFKFPYGPISGNTFAFSISQALPISDAFIQNTTLEADYRHYLPLGSNTLLAFRFNAFASLGKNPFIFYYGGNNQVRSADFYSIIGNKMWFSNLEFRFPLVNSASTLIGQIGPIRGTFFFDITRAKTGDYPAKLYTYVGPDPDDPFRPYYKASDAIGSYGYGFEFFFLGLPIHLEFARRLEWEDISKPFSYNKWGKLRTVFWIGYDF